MNVVEPVLVVVGFVAGLAALVIALWQVYEARRASSLQARNSVLGVAIAAELADTGRPEVLRPLYDAIEKTSADLAGRDKRFRNVLDLIRRVFEKDKGRS